MTGITASTFVQPADFAKELQQYLGDKSGGPVRNVMNARASHPLVLDRSSQRVNQSKSNAVFPKSTHSFWFLQEFRSFSPSSSISSETWQMFPFPCAHQLHDAQESDNVPRWRWTVFWCLAIGLPKNRTDCVARCALKSCGLAHWRVAMVSCCRPFAPKLWHD